MVFSLLYAVISATSSCLKKLSLHGTWTVTYIEQCY